MCLVGDVKRVGLLMGSMGAFRGCVVVGVKGKFKGWAFELGAGAKGMLIEKPLSKGWAY